VTYLTCALYVHHLWFYKHQHENRVRSKLFVACQRWWFQWRFWFVPSVPGEMHNYCTLHIIKENFENFLIHRCNYILLSQVYCVWQVVKTPTIILNNPLLNWEAIDLYYEKIYEFGKFLVIKSSCFSIGICKGDVVFSVRLELNIYLLFTRTSWLLPRLNARNYDVGKSSVTDQVKVASMLWICILAAPCSNPKKITGYLNCLLRLCSDFFPGMQGEYPELGK